MRGLIAFTCDGAELVGTLDDASGSTGLLIVSGGNEIRIGAHRGMALLAARLAQAGVPVFRFDRRGIGDSQGENGGYLHSGPDIAAAASAFRAAAPGVRHVLGFGNCDGASALALFHGDAAIDALALSNPWVIEASDDMPPAAAIRARYWERLRDPAAWARLLRGGVDIGKLAGGLRKISSKAAQAPDSIADQIARALAASPAPLTILLAERDNTAIAFADAWKGPAFAGARARATLATCPTDSHGFHRAADKDWLFDQLRAAAGRLA